MSTWFWITTVVLAIVAVAMVLIILVQRPQGGGLAGAFGGAGGSSTETVFGGRVGDALTYATVAAFVVYLGLAITLNLLDNIDPSATGAPPPPGQVSADPSDGTNTAPLPPVTTPTDSDTNGEKQQPR